jgi:hypothetical protein
MNRGELSALRDAIDVLLKLPDPLRDQVAQWLAPEAAKPNGRDHDPPPTAPKLSGNADGFQRPSLPEIGKTAALVKPRHGKSPAAKAEQRLLAAMQDLPGSTVIALANAVGASRSQTDERLRGLAARGLVTKDGAGHWRLVGDLAGEHARPPQPSPAAS